MCALHMFSHVSNKTCVTVAFAINNCPITHFIIQINDGIGTMWNRSRSLGRGRCWEYVILSTMFQNK